MLHGNAVGAEVRRLIADAHAEDDATLRHQVERDDVLGHAHGMVERQEDDGGPDAQGVVRAATAVATMSGEGRKPSLS